jgi:hypothetical protein
VRSRRDFRCAISIGWRFDDDLRDLPALAAVPIEAYVLVPLDREMLRDVIEGFARLARLRRSATGSDAPAAEICRRQGNPTKHSTNTYCYRKITGCEHT